MKKALIILNIIISLFVININNVKSDSLPIIEHACFNRYADKALLYSFYIDDGSKVNTTALDISDPNVKHVVINVASDMCLYSSSPSKCYDCITLERYGLNQTRDTPVLRDSDYYSSVIFKVLLGAVILILIIILFYNLKSKKQTKHLKPKK